MISGLFSMIAAAGLRDLDHLDFDRGEIIDDIDAAANAFVGRDLVSFPPELSFVA